MLIRLISDLHIDVNKNFPFSFRGKNKDIYTLIAGDVSGNPYLTAEWVKHNIANGILISGNHDVYNNLGWTLQKNKQYLADNFPLDSDVTYMDETVGVMCKKIPDTDIIVIGSCMYTDYEYSTDAMKHDFEYCYNSEKNRARLGWQKTTIKEVNMRNGARGLNDFRWGKMEDELDDDHLKQRPLLTADYEKMFHKTFDKIKELVEDHSDKKIIVVSHHCPSPKCISSQYVDSDMNASYVSDLEDFIVNHPQIKVWHCGHVHHQTNFKIGNCLIVMNPRGYERQLESLKWNPNTFVDTDTWEIVTKTYNNKKLNEARKKAEEDMRKCLAWLWY